MAADVGGDGSEGGAGRGEEEGGGTEGRGGRRRMAPGFFLRPGGGGLAGTHPGGVGGSGDPEAESLRCQIEGPKKLGMQHLCARVCVREFGGEGLGGGISGVTNPAHLT